MAIYFIVMLIVPNELRKRYGDAIKFIRSLACRWNK
jgi:hypothetical protein